MSDTMLIFVQILMGPLLLLGIGSVVIFLFWVGKKIL